jgi:hypothetical protein
MNYLQMSFIIFIFGLLVKIRVSEDIIKYGRWSV